MKQYLLISILLLGTVNLKAQTLYVTSGGSVVAQNTAVNIAGNAAVTSGSALVGAKVSISSNFVAAQDVLGLNGAASGGISSSYNATSGVFTLSGSATAADYQATLQKVTYMNTSANPSTSARVITFSLNAALPFTGNGHYYEYVTSSNISWSSANTAANARTYFGLQGYLATVTSADENTFVSAKLGGNGCWMGGSDETVEGTWKWMTGPESGNTLTYFNWGASQPDNYNGVEDYLQFFAAGTWNDLPNAASAVEIAGYVVEYGGMTSDPVLHISDNVMVNFAPLLNNLTVSSGINIKWYDAASDGNLLSATTVLENGHIYYASQTVNNVESSARLAVTATIYPSPQGSLSANGPLCVTGAGMLTWTATTGTGPYTVVYYDGTANRTVSNVSSGTPFAVYTTPVTSRTTYTLVSVQDANCTRSGGFTGNTATITVSANPSASTAGTHTPSQTQVVWNWTAASGATGYKWNTTIDYGSATDMGTATTQTETSLTCNTTYTRYVWAYNASGCVSGVTTLTQTTSACVVLLAIGDEYGGGMVAYILQSDDYKYNASVQHGLIVALTDQSISHIWGDGLGYDTPITSVALGQGSANTTAIINLPTANTAAAMCRNYSGGAYNDWYLPSRDELGKIFLKYAVMGMTKTNYWSSSEQSTGAGAYAYYYNFSDGSAQINYKHITYCYVRAVRSF